MVQWLRLLAPHTGVRIQSLVRELDPTRNNKELVRCKKERRSPVLQLRSGANWCEQTCLTKEKEMLDNCEHSLHLAHFSLIGSPLSLPVSRILTSSVSSYPSPSPACLFKKEYTAVAQRERHNSSQHSREAAWLPGTTACALRVDWPPPRKPYAMR